MLVLSRKVGQTIQIGDQVSITITQIKGKNIRIGIQAPAEVAIRRGELDTSDKQPTALPAGASVDLAMPACSYLG